MTRRWKRSHQTCSLRIFKEQTKNWKKRRAVDSAFFFVAARRHFVMDTLELPLVCDQPYHHTSALCLQKSSGCRAYFSCGCSLSNLQGAQPRHRTPLRSPSTYIVVACVYGHYLSQAVHGHALHIKLQGINGTWGSHYSSSAEFARHGSGYSRAHRWPSWTLRNFPWSSSSDSFRGVRQHSPQTSGQRRSRGEKCRRSSRTSSHPVLRPILPAAQISLTRQHTSESLLAVKLSRIGIFTGVI